MPRTLPRTSPTSLKPQVKDLVSVGAVVRSTRALQALRIDDAAAGCYVSSDVFSRLENGKPVKLDSLLKVLYGMGLAMLIVPNREAPSVLRHIDELRNEASEESHCRQRPAVL